MTLDEIDHLMDIMRKHGAKKLSIRGEINIEFSDYVYTEPMLISQLPRGNGTADKNGNGHSEDDKDDIMKSARPMVPAPDNPYADPDLWPDGVDPASLLPNSNAETAIPPETHGGGSDPMR